MRSSGSGARLATFVIYDTDDDRVRSRMSETCLDYGLERIQFSAFLGSLSANERQELALRLTQNLHGVQDAAGRIYIQPVCETDRTASRQITRGILQADLPPDQRTKGRKRKLAVRAIPGGGAAHRAAGGEEAQATSGADDPGEADG